MVRTYTKKWDEKHPIKTVCSECNFIYYLDSGPPLGSRSYEEMLNEPEPMCPYCGSIARTQIVAWVKNEQGIYVLVDSDSNLSRMGGAVRKFNKKGECIYIAESIV
ncbi:MAG: hypothetical protein QXR38_04175 [Nitrososphaerales archaeon]